MLDKQKAEEWIRLFKEDIYKNKAYLSDLDTPIGDMDHGTNMDKGMHAYEDSLKVAPAASLGDVFLGLGKAIISNVGGASGPFYGSAFKAFALVIGDQTQVDDDVVIAMVQAALDKIQKWGNAAEGSKTMVDVWAPVLRAMRDHSLTEALIEDAFQATAPMKATRGRASYLGERSIGHLDPGACSSAYLFKAMLKSGAFNG